MATQLESVSIERDLLALKKYVDLLHGSWRDVRAEVPLISERLKMGTGHKDSKAHSRAYRDLFSLVKKMLNKIPEQAPQMPIFEKPKEVKRAVELAKKGDAPIPLINTGGTVYMGCIWCDDWVDVTKLFTEGKFNAIYSCPEGHNLFFAGVPQAPTIHAEVKKAK